MKYSGNFIANSSTTLKREVLSNNKRKLNSELRNMAMENRFEHSPAIWFVFDDNGKCVYDGKYIPNVGIRYFIYNYKRVNYPTSI